MRKLCRYRNVEYDVRHYVVDDKSPKKTLKTYHIIDNNNYIYCQKHYVGNKQNFS